MEIAILKEFIALVESCNFQETAADMNLSQSSLTKHIHKLEEELGVSLFDRSTRSVKLNKFSKTYYPYAQKIVAEHEESLRALEELSEVSKNEFTVAYMPMIGQYGLVNTISDFSIRYPDINLKTIESGHPLELLRNRKCDFAFLFDEEIPDENFNKMIYKSDHLAVVLPADHPLASYSSLTLNQLKDEKFIIHISNNENPHEDTLKFNKLCEEFNFSPEIVSESLFTATMVRFVAAKRGIAVLNRLHVPKDIDNIRVVDISPTTRSYIYMVYRRKLSTSSATQFLHYMIETTNA